MIEREVISTANFVTHSLKIAMQMNMPKKVKCDNDSCLVFLEILFFHKPFPFALVPCFSSD